MDGIVGAVAVEGHHTRWVERDAGRTPPTRRDIEEAARYNVTLRAYLQAVQVGSLTYEEALAAMVLTLADQNQRMITERLRQIRESFVVTLPPGAEVSALTGAAATATAPAVPTPTITTGPPGGASG